MPVIDIHTHMLTLEWIELLRAHGAKYSVKKTPGNQDAVHLYDAPFMTLMPGMWDYAMRIKNMDQAGVDIAVVSLTCPNVFWGGREVSLSAARIANDSMWEQQRANPDRIRWFASLPWQYEIDARAELARCIKNGAVDRYRNLKLIAAHGGAALPYLAGRFDICHEKIPACSAVIKDKPSSYLKRIYYDTVVYEQAALDLCIKVAGSTENVLYGSDYPHNIGDMAGCLARVNSLPSRQAKQIAGKNAERIFKL
jgi:predicted TIM-barrel fold metal-dependent hydrolase